MAKYQVVIVGGGFGGIKAGIELSKDPYFEVTLIHDAPDFRYYPTLFRTATGGKKMVSSIPVNEIFARLPIHLAEDSMVDIDRKSHNVITASGKNYHYDALILALGVKTNYFNIEGLDKYSYGIKTVEDAERFKYHLHQQLVDDKKPDLNYVIVGGGPTGIELAGALPKYLHQIADNHNIANRDVHVDLVEGGDRLLPRMPKALSRKVTRELKRLGVKIFLKTSVQAETADALMINNKPLTSHSVVWTAGTTNNSFFSTHNFQLTTKGRVRVDQFLQAEPGIYVIGDNADTPYSGLAQTAIYDAKFLAKNLSRIADKQDPIPYIAKKPIYVFPAGPHWAAVLWGSFSFYGRLGHWLREFADLFGFHDYEPWKLASRRMVAEAESEESCPICATSETSKAL